MHKPKQSNNDNSLLISIVNYRVAELTIDCLHSLAPQVHALKSVSVVVVDNNSGDDSVEMLNKAIKENNWTSWASVIASDHNGGYSFGNNLAIRPALTVDSPPAYFFVLNPDTVVRPNALNILLNYMQEHPKAGICGPSLEDSQGKLHSIAFRFPSILSEFESGIRLGPVSKILSRWVVARNMPDEICQADWIPGGAMLIRREVFEHIGLMDDGYFLFYEETDLCLRAHRAGWSCWYVPQARVMDIGGQSRKKTQANVSNRKPSYWFDSRRRYFKKNHGFLYAALADTAGIMGFSLWRLREFITRNKNKEAAPDRFLRDFMRHSVFLKNK